MSEELKRASDQSGTAVAAQVAKATSRTFWDWFEQHHIDSLAVICVTLWITITVVEWAMDFPDAHPDMDGVKVGAIIASVLTPWGVMQAAMFKFYADLKAKSNGQTAVK